MQKIETQIQQLCSLGLDSRLLMPRLLSLLHGFIPSFANVFFWIDDNGKISDIYDENPESYLVLPLFLEHYYNQREREVWCGLEASVKYRQALSIEHLWTVDQKTLMMHGFYNDFLQKCGNHWGLQKPIWVMEKAKGLLLLKRTEKESNFTQNDVIKLERISKHIEHALSYQDFETKLIDGKPTEKAVLIVDVNGKIHHYTNRAERIMMLSQGEDKFRTYRRYSVYHLPARLMALVQRLRQVQFGEYTAPATEIFSNQWGKFRFSIFPLNANNQNDAENLYVIQIEHLVPMPIIMMDKIDRFELTSRQTQICLNIGLGKTYSDIADSLGIMESTVISHKKEIFKKIGVATRHDLSEKILF